MKIPEQATRLSILIGESDRHDGRPVYEVVVNKARQAGLAGASVFHGVMGFGANSRLHTARILRLSEDLPVLIEIVDSPEKIEAFAQSIDSIVGDGLITEESVKVRRYRGDSSAGKA
jgi:PII-like signaling protein